jgi:hypothetical protein
MTTQTVTTVLDQIVSAAFGLACAMPEAHNGLSTRLTGSRQ